MGRIICSITSLPYPNKFTQHFCSPEVSFLLKSYDYSFVITDETDTVRMTYTKHIHY